MELIRGHINLIRDDHRRGAHEAVYRRLRERAASRQTAPPLRAIASPASPAVRARPPQPQLGCAAASAATTRPLRIDMKEPKSVCEEVSSEPAPRSSEALPPVVEAPASTALVAPKMPAGSEVVVSTCTISTACDAQRSHSQ